MKSILLIMLSLLIILGYSQDSTKSVFKERLIDKSKKQAASKAQIAPYNPLKLAGSFGLFKIVHAEILISSQNTKKLVNQLKASEITLEENGFHGPQIDSVSFKISELELLTTEDYLFRLYGQIIDTLPPNLPKRITMQKTTNLICYGIGRLPNGTTIIPYRGLLLYLKK